MRNKGARLILWVGTIFALVGIPAISAAAEGPGRVPWIVGPAANEGPGMTPWIVGPGSNNSPEK